MPLKIETLSDKSTWVEVGKPLSESDRPGTASCISPEGDRELIIFFCAAPDYSIVNKLKGDLQTTELKNLRVIEKQEGVEMTRLATLRRGDDPYFLAIQTGKPILARRIIKFTHI